ncbi:MAG: hypothetical protein IJ364_02410 [Oscillospiraceae bacterium]|nr:hypothetical protein [Oscillospiraceae bacterium]
MAQTTKKENNNGLLKTAIILLLLFVLLLGGVLCYFLVIKPNNDKGVKGGQRESAALQGSINVMSEEEIQEALNNIVEEGMFRISIASDIIAVEDGKAQLRIENNLQNRYIMQVSIYLDENGKEIYSTDLIDPGYYIQEAELDEHLDPGEHAATAIFTALYPDTEEIVGTVGANVTIHVYPKNS